MSRIALVVTYNGQPFHGWQVQTAELSTVQQALQGALEVVTEHPVTVHCAGRTDTGVHATKQVVHLDTSVVRPDRAWVMGVNTHLPDDIAVVWAGQAPADFDARRSALARRYLYLIYNRRVRSALMPGYITHYPPHLDEKKMRAAARHLIGEQDFTSFRASGCQSHTPIRKVRHVSIGRSGDLVVIDIQANSFLHHIVRNIVGVLMDIGVGNRPVAWMGELLALKQRALAGRTAAAHGLYLIDVIYHPSNGIPGGPNLPHLLGSLMIKSTGWPEQ